jgi:hypothetical protein
MNRINVSLFILVTTCVHFSCSKPTGNSGNSNSPGDAVVGNYLAVNVPSNFVSGSAVVSKTGTGKYQFIPGTASIPTFSFEYDALASFFAGANLGYLIPKQNSNAGLLDSTYITFYTTGAKIIDFTITSRAASSSWRYSGVKQ